MKVPNLARMPFRRLNAGPRPSAHPYAELDMVLARRLAGAIWLLGAVYCVAVSLAAAPPPAGRPAMAAVIAAAVLIGVWMVRGRTALAPLPLLLSGYVAIAGIAVLGCLGNRRALEESVAVATAAARRTGTPLSALFADVDSFKAINDTWGHGAGDLAIRDVARAFASGVRVPDPCFRWGGDELVALLPHAPLDEAEAIAARVSEAIRASCRRPDGEPLSIMIGCATLRDGESGDDMLARADMLLMAAKADNARR